MFHHNLVPHSTLHSPHSQQKLQSQSLFSLQHGSQDESERKIIYIEEFIFIIQFQITIR